MGSVVTFWSGRLPPGEQRREFLAYLKRVAQRHHAWRMKRTPGSPSPSAGVQGGEFGDRSPMMGEESPFFTFEDRLHARIVWGRSLVLFDQLDPALQAQARPFTEGQAGASSQDGASLFFGHDEEQRYVLTIPSVRLHGLAFRIDDPRHRFPGEDMMSFVFVDIPSVPVLDGQLVYPNPSVGRFWEGEQEPTIEGAWLLETPTLRLDGYLEDWFDLLMAWIKIFFIPDFEYWRDELYNRFESIRGPIDRLIRSHGFEFAKEAAMEYLLDDLDETASRF